MVRRGLGQFFERKTKMPIGILFWVLMIFWLLFELTGTAATCAEATTVSWEVIFCCLFCWE